MDDFMNEYIEEALDPVSEEAQEEAPEEVLTSEDVDYTDILLNIQDTLTSISSNQIMEIEAYERYTQELLRTNSVNSVPTDDVLNDQVEHITVSEDSILTKEINNYTVSESLLLVVFLSLLFAGFVLLVRKAVYKWK